MVLWLWLLHTLGPQPRGQGVSSCRVVVVVVVAVVVVVVVVVVIAHRVPWPRNSEVRGSALVNCLRWW